MKCDHAVPFEQRYELREQLLLDGPHGGWLALDRLLGRKVVVNLPYCPDDEQRFLHRAHFRARLRHANLVPLYELGATRDGTPFFTEPYIEVTDLGRLRLDGEQKLDGVTLDRVVSYLLDVCKAVAFVHANGYRHLELRPENVLVAPESQEVFLECRDLFLPPLPMGIIRGVPTYMAPEQADPKALGAADVRTDVYGLGGILFEILYDNPPNGRGTASLEILKALAARKRPPPRGTLGRRAARCRELAWRLEPVCMRALEYDRTARPMSVLAFRNEVEQCAWRYAS